ncbi:protein kinase domain-containing protein [Streptomyces sp. G45]|uniref:protein kinase domain-containing protein n=1 Tax=Streptomyces sp. G45 TaxID=3406627 RepID=UPI003C25B715
MTAALLDEDPERYGSYWLAARLGSGGQGVVYEAYGADGARVALKALHRGAEPFVRERFGKEADAARRVASFCTARILDVSADGDTPFIVSEYVPGVTLADAVRGGGPLPADALTRLAIGAATALVAIHGAGVVHRDLKPGNVLLGPDGPRVIDFGIARAPDMSLTATGKIMGTFGYMAPEVLAGRRATQASDVFAWAAVVVYAASGTEPFRGAHIGEVVHRTAALDPDLSALPPRMRPLVAAALAKEPELRPTARELLLGLVGELPESADPRKGLLEAGARRAAEPAATEAVPPLGDRAEAAYAALPGPVQLAAQELLLRLVVPGDAADGAQDSVRTAGRAELEAERPGSERRATRAAVDALAAAGALVVDEDGSVRPVSAALIPAWRRLREWVAADRDRIAAHRRLGGAALAWQAAGERADDLLRGTALTTGLDWLATAPYQLRPNPLELRFVTASRDEAARADRRRRQLLSGVAALTALVLLAGTVAWFQARDSRRNAAEADRRRAQATARSVAQAADRLRGDQPDTSLLLSLAAWRIAETPESRSALNSAATQRETAVLSLPSVNGAHGTGELLVDSGRTLLQYTPGKVTLRDLTQGQKAAAKPYATLRGEVMADDVPEPLISADGRFLLLTGTADDAPYRVVSTRDGKPVAKPLPHQPGYGPDQLTNQGQVLFGSRDPQPERHSYRLLTASGTRVAAWSQKNSAALSPDGAHIVSCAVGSRTKAGPMEVRTVGPDGAGRLVFDTRGKDLYDNLNCGRGITFSADGARVALHTETGTYVWKTATGERAGSAREEDLESPALSRDGRHVQGVTEDGEMEIWSLDDSESPLFRRSPGRGVTDDQIQLLLDDRTDTLVYVTDVPHQVHRLDLRTVLSGGARGKGVTGAGVSADGRVGLYRTGGRDRPVQHLVDLRTGKESGAPIPQGPGPGQAVTRIYSTLSGDGRVLAFTDYRPRPGKLNLSVSVWDTRAHKELFRAPVPEGRLVANIVLSPDGRHLAYAYDYGGVPTPGGGSLDVWDLRTRQRVHTYKGIDGYGQFSQDSRHHVTTRGDVLDLATGRVRRVDLGSENIVDLAFSPDGRHLAVIKETGWVELWDGEVTERRARMPSSTVRGASRGGATLYRPAISPDGSLLAAVADEDSVQLWDLDARLALGEPLELMGRDIDGLAFDADGVLRALTGDRTPSLDLTPQRLAAAVCAKAGRDITRAEWRTYVPDAPYRSLC